MSACGRLKSTALIHIRCRIPLIPGTVLLPLQGRQYFLHRSHPVIYDELSFVAENGAFIKDRKELVFTVNMPKETSE